MSHKEKRIKKARECAREKLGRPSCIGCPMVKRCQDGRMK